MEKWVSIRVQKPGFAVANSVHDWDAEVDDAGGREDVCNH